LAGSRVMATRTWIAMQVTSEERASVHIGRETDLIQSHFRKSVFRAQRLVLGASISKPAEGSTRYGPSRKPQNADGNQGASAACCQSRQRSVTARPETTVWKAPNARRSENANQCFDGFGLEASLVPVDDFGRKDGFWHLFGGFRVSGAKDCEVWPQALDPTASLWQ
jgi:hypothetical protein